MSCDKNQPVVAYLRYQEWPEHEGEVVEFRLIYKGKLPAQGSGGGNISKKSTSSGNNYMPNYVSCGIEIASCRVMSNLRVIHVVLLFPMQVSQKRP